MTESFTNLINLLNDYFYQVPALYRGNDGRWAIGRLDVMNDVDLVDWDLTSNVWIRRSQSDGGSLRADLLNRASTTRGGARGRADTGAGGGGGGGGGGGTVAGGGASGTSSDGKVGSWMVENSLWNLPSNCNPGKAEPHIEMVAIRDPARLNERLRMYGVSVDLRTGLPPCAMRRLKKMYTRGKVRELRAGVVVVHVLDGALLLPMY